MYLIKFLSDIQW